ncbi:MAG: hypothetical protein ACRD1X_12315 [Vicinamibacteria bacterium]
MGELLAFEGVWSAELIKRMVPVAMTIEADQAEARYLTFRAAVGSIFAPETGKVFTGWLDQVRNHARSQAAPDGRAAKRREAAEAIREGFGQLGIVARRKGGRK